MKPRLLGVLCAGVFSFVSQSTNAALIDRGGGLIYDDILDVTWLQDANYAATQYTNSGGLEGAASGVMTWDEATAWANGLSYFDSVRNVTYDDWRLPTVSPIGGSSFDLTLSSNGTTDQGYARTTTDGTDGGWRNDINTPVSEMGHMYYVNLGSRGLCDPNLPWCTSQVDWGLANTGPFSNIESVYWSGTALGSSDAWNFTFHLGAQAVGSTDLGNLAWAVRTGDVGASMVPVPAAFWLFGSGLLGLVGMARCKKAA